MRFPETCFDMKYQSDTQAYISRSGYMKTLITKRLVKILVGFLILSVLCCDNGVPTKVTGVYSISGRVLLNGTPADSIAVKLGGDQTHQLLTDTTGNFSFDNLENGLYSVKPAADGYVFNPVSRSLEIKEQNLSGVNFTMQAISSSADPSSTAIQFGEVCPGDSATFEFFISNNGTDNLRITGITFSNSGFSSNVSTLEVLPDGLGMLIITYVASPADSGVVNDTLRLATNDPANPLIIITLNAFCSQNAPAQISVDRDTLDFGFVRLGNSSTEWITIKNTGADTLIVSVIDPANANLTIDNSMKRIVPGAESLLEVTYEPLALDSLKAVITLTSNASNNPRKDIVVLGYSSGQKPSKLTITPQEINFGEALLDSVVIRDLVVRNTGSDTLIITVAESDTPQFGFTVTPRNQYLAPGQTRTISLTFIPDSKRDFAGNITIYSSDPDLVSLKVPVKGTGIYPPPSYYRFNTGRAGSSTIDFGESFIGVKSTASFYLVNPTSFPLNINGVSLSNTQTFQTDADSSFVLNGLDSVVIKVTFSPQAAGQFTDKLKFATNSLSGDSGSVSLIGSAIVSPPSKITLSTSNIDFGLVYLPKTGNRGLTITNTGSGNLVINAVSVNGNNFSAENFSGTITPGGARPLSVFFTPSASGFFQAELLVDSNDPESPQSKVTLFGTAVDTVSFLPIMTLSTRQLNFGSALINTSKSADFVIKNIGKDTLQLNTVRSTIASFLIDSYPDIILPAGQASIRVTFVPQGEGEQSGLVLITTNDPVHSLDSVRVTATGVLPGGIVTDNDIYIEGGTFLMACGSTTDIQREVTVSGFYIDRYEVTNQEYKEFLDAGGYNEIGYWTSEGWQWRTSSTEYGFNPNDPKPRYWGSGDTPWDSDPYSNGADLPVVGVSWYEAKAYATFRGKNLPTEAQWEYAARKDRCYKYPWGDEYVNTFSNHGQRRSPYLDASDGYQYAAPVGMYESGATPEGIYDMAGNVMEWCRNWIADYDPNSVLNPQGPSTGFEKVIRGGSYYGDTDFIRAFHRNKSEPKIRYRDGGIRLVREN